MRLWSIFFKILIMCCSIFISNVTSEYSADGKRKTFSARLAYPAHQFELNLLRIERNSCATFWKYPVEHFENILLSNSRKGLLDFYWAIFAQCFELIFVRILRKSDSWSRSGYFNSKGNWLMIPIDFAQYWKRIGLWILSKCGSKFCEKSTEGSEAILAQDSKHI